MTEVKIPEPDIETTMFSRDSSTQHYFTEAQLKQYGDDRAREALEMAAKVCENESCSCSWTEDATEMASHLQDAIRVLAKEIK